MTASARAKCVGCEGETTVFGSREGYDYVRCVRCGTVQLDPMPSRHDLDRAYSEDYATSGHYGTDPEKIFVEGMPFYRAVVEALAEVGEDVGRVLDFGCGWGGMCRLLKAGGRDYMGIDFESESLEYCRASGLNVRAESLESLASAGERFDAMVMVTVFEHLQDHEAFFDDARRVLGSDGALVVLIPTSGLTAALAQALKRLWRKDDLPAVNTTFTPPWHTAIFSVPGFKAIARRKGFVVERVKASPSGNATGAKGLVQSVATFVARSGFAVFGDRWPLVVNHVFVCRPA